MPSPAPVAAAPITGTVTLITGDRVTLAVRDGHVRAEVQAGPGRDRVAFSIQERGGDIVVVPDDVAALIGADRLDPELFDVTRLLADGYGDDRRDDLPLIVARQPDAPALRSRMASTGVTIDRALPALHMMAVRQRKASAGAVLVSLDDRAARAATTAAALPPKIWLDRRRKPLLDRSVPQIGAPAAYARGFTGAGVTVAVLDTGVDTTHPDLAGKVATAETFIDDGLGTSDVFGHGTHVASIVAGTGAASQGRFHGVAPDATLISGRVCDQSGNCPDSAILAAMEWAVATQHAPIVNLSLGGPDSPGIDPLEDAVNQLSAEFGALFVIAAGNDGQRQTIESPGSADAALTVGAVGRDESLASFSSQGPRAGDHAVKPDITAPGVGIVAARAAGTRLGGPVGDSYVALNGTSMATPHVAGAAAILHQQHPDWTGAQLKAALVGAANPNPALTVYQQGSGRVDVDRATRQAVTAAPASVSLGVVRSSHDDDPLLTQTVRYTNPGPAPVVLQLDAALAIPGRPAPSGMISVAPSTLTVPAGGAADAVVAVDTGGALRDGVYGGALTASGDGVRIVTPVGVELALDSFDLTISMVGRDGQPAAFALLLINGVGELDDPATDVHLFQDITGPTTFRLPRGTYSLVSEDFGLDAALMIAPRFALVADTQLVVDGRLARPLDVTLPEPGLVVSQLVWDFDDLRSFTAFAAISNGSLAEGEFGPSAAPGEIQSLVSAALVPPGDGPPSRIYHVARRQADHVQTGWQQTIGTGELATVEASHVSAEGQQFIRSTAGISTPASLFIIPADFLYTGPFHSTELYFGDGFVWDTALQRQVPRPDFPEVTTTIEQLDQVREYRPGHSYVERWNRAPFGPAFAGETRFSLFSDFSGAPVRLGDTLLFIPSMFSDQAIPSRSAASQVTRQRVTLSRDGEVISSQDGNATMDFLIAGVPPEPAQYRLEDDATRPADQFALSTHVTAAWTFRSQHADGDPLALPLPMLRFLPELDDHNQTAARVLVLPIRIERPLGAATPRIARVHVDASFDDGATWFPVPTLLLGDRALGLVVHPRGATSVSLRGTAADLDGNAVEQTIIRAYAVAPR